MKRLISDLSPRMTGIDNRLSHVEFVVDEVAFGHVSVWVIQVTIIIVLMLLVSEGQAGWRSLWTSWESGALSEENLFFNALKVRGIPEIEWEREVETVKQNNVTPDDAANRQIW